MVTKRLTSKIQPAARIEEFSFGFAWGSIAVQAGTFSDAIEQVSKNLPHVDMRTCITIRRTLPR